MFGECHAHMLMDGIDYRKAVDRHKTRPDEAFIRGCFERYKEAGVGFIRDGGDNCGVSVLAKQLALEYGIDYRTPVFAIHKTGHYGSIVGKSFSTMKEYHELVMEAGRQGADFIKIMTTGLLDFSDHGKITGSPLDRAEVKEMVHIAHEEGFKVMSHTNGVYGVQAAIEAEVDSLEHGNYMDEECVSMLADSSVVWVPTLVTIRNLEGCGRYEEQVLAPIISKAEENLRYAFEKKARVALGSDAGAYRVMHGQGIQDEYHAFQKILGKDPYIDTWIQQGEDAIRQWFTHPQS